MISITISVSSHEMRRSLSSKAERSIFIELILLIEPIIFSSSLVGFSKSSQAFCSSFDIENNSIFLFNLFSASCIFINSYHRRQGTRRAGLSAQSLARQIQRIPPHRSAHKYGGASQGCGHSVRLCDTGHR